MKKGVKEREQDCNNGNIFNVTSYSITEIWKNLSSVFLLDFFLLFFFCFLFLWVWLAYL